MEKSKGKNSSKAIIISIIAILISLGVIIYDVNLIKKQHSNSGDSSNDYKASSKAAYKKASKLDDVIPSVSPTSIPATEITPTAIPSTAPTEALTETSTNMSVSDIYEEAKQIYEEEFSEIAGRTNMSKEEFINTIANIRSIFYYSEIPENEQYLGINTIEYYMAKRIELYGNACNPSDSKLPLYCVNYSASDLSEIEKLSYDQQAVNTFMSKYDRIYNDIYTDLNSKNYDKADTDIKSLTWMLYDDFVLGGLYSGVDPYAFKQQYLPIAFGSAIDRYTPVAEYLMENQSCISLCVNQETGKWENVNQLSVIQALTSKDGKSKDGKIVLDQLNDAQIESLVKTFNNQLVSIIDYKLGDNPISRVLK